MKIPSDLSTLSPEEFHELSGEVISGRRKLSTKQLLALRDEAVRRLEEADVHLEVAERELHTAERMAAVGRMASRRVSLDS